MVYEKEITCPYCGHKGTDFNFEKEWLHGSHLVNRFSCPSCGGRFRYYWGERGDGTPFHYIIKKP